MDLVSARIIERERGVVAPSALGGLRDFARGFVKRLFAVPLGATVGVWVGVFMAPAVLLLAGSWPRKLGRFLLAPFAGLLLGTRLGARVLRKGKADLLPLAAQFLHRFCPVVTLPKALAHHGLGLVLVTRYEDVRTVLERQDVFRVDLYDERMRATTGAFFLGMDDGAYENEQGLAAAALGRDIAPLRDYVGKLAGALVDKAAERSRTIDVVTELAHAVQRGVLEQYFGIPDTRDERLLPWLETTSFHIFNFWIAGPYRAAAIDAGRELVAHLRGVVRDRLERAPSGKIDVVGRLLETMRDRGLHPELPAHENLAVRTLAGLIAGATVPTIGAMVGAIDVLLDLPAFERKRIQNAALAGDAVAVRRVLREAARFCTYPPTLYRHATMPYVFAPGTRHQATAQRGAWVVTAPNLANFDARVFERPERFDADREDSPERAPLLFGWARHRCLGEHMAELLLTEMARPLLARGIRRVAGEQGQLQRGKAGLIPDGGYARRLVVRLG